MFKLNFSLKKLCKIFLILLAAFSVSVFLVQLIPNERIRENITESAILMDQEGNYPFAYYPQNYSFRLDNYSEGAILSVLYLSDNQHPFKSAFAQNEYGVSEYPGMESLVHLVSMDEIPSGYMRSSYWLGIRVFLRPFLVIGNYFDFRIILQLLSYLLAAAAILSLASTFHSLLAMLFAFALWICNFQISTVSAICAPLYMLSFIAIIYICRNQKKDINYGYISFILGCFTIFFDWFSFPTMTWGLVAITVILLEEKKGRRDFSHYFNIVFNMGVTWCAGYAAMLLAKVGLSILVSGKAGWEYFIGRVLADSGGHEDSSFLESAFTANKLCINQLIPNQFLSNINENIPLIVCGILILTAFVISFRRIKEDSSLIMLSLISLVPVAWVSLFSSFHIIHFWFAYRTYFSMVWAMLALFYIIYNRIWLNKKSVSRVSSESVVLKVEGDRNNHSESQ